MRFDTEEKLSQENVNHLRAFITYGFTKNRKKWKPYTIAETLIMPCCKDIVGCLLGEKAASKPNAIPISNDTVHRRIVEMGRRKKIKLFLRLKRLPLVSLVSELMNQQIYQPNLSYLHT